MKAQNNNHYIIQSHRFWYQSTQTAEGYLKVGVKLGRR